jgi:hypothetical protein
MRSRFALLLCLSLPVPVQAQDASPTPRPQASPPSESSVGPVADSADAESGKGIQLGALVGYGLVFDDNVGSVNPLGLGLGALGGAHVGPLYVGGRLLFYLGGGSDLPTGRLSMSEWLLAAEGGYPLELGDLMTLRPGLVVGAAFFSQDGPTRSSAGPYIAGTADGARARLYVAPGASLLLPFGRVSPDLALLYAGLDARIGLYIGDPTSGSIESSLVVGVEL